MRRMNLLISVALVVAVFLPSVSFAQQNSGLRLVTSPLPLNISADPGATAQAAIKVKNDGSDTERLKISLMKFKAYGDNGLPQLMDPEPGDDFLGWVSFSEDRFPIGPQEWKTVVATFNVPQDAALGYYYAIVFSRDDESDGEGGKTAIAGGTAVLALLEVKSPDESRSLSLTGISASRRVYEFLPADLTVSVRNVGNIHAAPHGTVFISRNGREVAQLSVNPYLGNILPASTRIFETSWSDGFPRYEQEVSDGKIVLDEAGRPKMRLTWNWEDLAKIRFGKYDAKAVLVYDDGSRDIPLEGMVSFWVIPWRMLLAVCLILLFVAVGIWSAVRKVLKKTQAAFSGKGAKGRA